MANYGNESIFGDPRSPGWEAQNLATIAAPNGQSWRVHRKAAPSFEGLIRDLVAAGYNPTSGGGFNYRPIRGGTRLSQHAFGNAIDISPATNAMGSTASDLPPNTAEIAAKYGLEWGGNWKNRPDPMHFEWRGPAGGMAEAPAPSPGGAQLSFGLPAMPTSPEGVAAMFGGQGLSMGVPADPFAGQAALMAERTRQDERDRADADMRRRAALFAPPAGGLASMFG